MTRAGEPGVEAGHFALQELERCAEFPRNATLAGSMKRLAKSLATWAFYAVGALAIAYLALFAYVTLTGRDFTPGDPIHIFRKPDAPSYS